MLKGGSSGIPAICKDKTASDSTEIDVVFQTESELRTGEKGENSRDEGKKVNFWITI